MKFVRPPLKIICGGLSKKLTNELADRLRLHFFDVYIWDEIIYAENPIDSHHYNVAWKILDKFEVDVI